MYFQNFLLTSVWSLNMGKLKSFISTDCMEPSTPHLSISLRLVVHPYALKILGNTWAFSLIES